MRKPSQSVESGRPTAPRARPTGESRPGRSFAVLLVLVLLLAAVIRAANVLWWRPTCHEDLVAVALEGQPEEFVSSRPGCFGIWGDAAYGHIQGRLIAEGHWFVDSFAYFLTKGEVKRPSAGDPPLYALYLGAVSAMGVTTGTGHRLASSALGVAGVALLALLARRLAGDRAGLVAGVVAALHPMLWINDGMLLSESLYVPLAAGVSLVAYRYLDDRTAWRATHVGFAVGMAALCRAEALSLLGLMVPALVWRAEDRKQAVLHAGAAGLACALTVAPWVAYNMTRFEEPTFMTAGTGAVLSAGSCDTAFYGEFTGYYAANCFQEYVDEGWVEWPDPWALDESERDAVSRDAALRYIREHIGRLPVVVAARIGRIWGVWAPIQNTRLDIDVEGRGRLASWVGLGVYYLLVPPTAFGLWSLRRRRVPLSPLLGWFAAVTLTAAVTFGVTRYRAPADAMMVVAAAVAVDVFLAKRSTSSGEG